MPFSAVLFNRIWRRRRNYTSCRTLLKNPAFLVLTSRLAEGRFQLWYLGELVLFLLWFTFSSLYPRWRFLVAVFCGMIARQMRSEMCDWIPSHSFKISFSGTSSFWSTPFHKITSAEYLKTTLEELSERTSTRMQHRYNFLQSEIKVSKYYNLNNADDSSSKHSL
jgi:hypothetical protein